ncbi:MAG: hypothetical protein PHY99_04370 [Bacteroidales bacterium]|nr:hypothetical protein [Bacteroidales bacterium]
MTINKRTTWHRLLFAVLMAGLVSSCTTEIDINSENQNVPIVYCVLNSADSFQYVRLQKTYLVDSKAGETPPDQDSVYFSGEIVVNIERLSEGQVVETHRFYPTTEIPKDSGFFPSEKNILYRAKMTIVPNSVYRLYIYLGSKEKVLYSEATTLSALKVLNPLPLKQRKISLYDGTNYICQWEPVTNAGIYQVAVRFKYKETAGGVTKTKFIDWPQALASQNAGSDYLSSSISGARFMHILDENLAVEAGVVRQVIGLDFYIVSGSIEMSYYIQSTSPTEGALMEKPVYNNITNGLGLFATESRVNIPDLILSPVTIDSIAYGQYTKNLGFLDHNNDRDSTNSY